MCLNEPPIINSQTINDIQTQLNILSQRERVHLIIK